MEPRPAWGFGRKFRVRDLQQSVAGMPTAALQDEILMSGKEQIHALFLHGGPMMSWPGQAKTREALGALDLLVTSDVEFSPTARVASYVIAVKMQLEMIAMTHLPESVGMGSYHPGYGWSDPYAAYAPALQDPPAGSDLIESWELYYGLAKRLGLQLTVGTAPLDMEHPVTADDVYDAMCKGSRIPLSEVRKYPHGHIFEEAREIVQPREPDCQARLELADPHMMRALAAVRAERIEIRRGTTDEFPLLMIPRRLHNAVNSYVMMRRQLKVPFNPAYLHPADLESRGLASGDLVKVRSCFGEIVGVVESDPGLRRGVLAMSHCFGGNPDEDDDPLEAGANTNRLLSMDYDYDSYTGIPRMSAVPVAVEKA
jgi:anaerobic selenocysteine-containing dehydrogenase